MKKTKTILLMIMILFSISFISCEKEDIQPLPTQTEEVIETQTYNLEIETNIILSNGSAKIRYELDGDRIDGYSFYTNNSNVIWNKYNVIDIESTPGSIISILVSGDGDAWGKLKIDGVSYSWNGSKDITLR